MKTAARLAAAVIVLPICFVNVEAVVETALSTFVKTKPLMSTTVPVHVASIV